MVIQHLTVFALMCPYLSLIDAIARWNPEGLIITRQLYGMPEHRSEGGHHVFLSQSWDSGRRALRHQNYLDVCDFQFLAYVPITRNVAPVLHVILLALHRIGTSRDRLLDAELLGHTFSTFLIGDV